MEFVDQQNQGLPRKIKKDCSMKEWRGRDKKLRGGEKRREAPGTRTKRLLYCFNVTNTSLDHLLLGTNADVDQECRMSRV
jgi:hypothetical protein